MNDKFSFLASRRSDAELYERVNNRERYLPETVEASLAELQGRGETFTDDVLRVIAEDMEARRSDAQINPGFQGLFNSADKSNQVDDPDAPAFFSRRAIYAFSILFSVLFGSILFAINIGSTEKKINVIWPLLYGFAFCVLEVVVLQYITPSVFLAFVLGIAGAIPLNTFMWRSFLSDETLYRPRKVWVPLAVGFGICILYVYLSIHGAK